MSENVTIAIILGSSRQPRLGDRVCTFMLSKAREVAGATFTVLDLADYKMPFKVSAFIPWSLTELVRYAVLLRQARLAAA